MPFLTPSPSPHLCVTKISNRKDASPPAKKQRFSSPSPPQARTKPIPKSLPLTTTIPQTIDYVKERHAAMKRLFDVWSSLAERYAKPIDEDDIVDIVTGEIVQDRGVVSSWDESKKGSFTDVGERTKKKGSTSKAGERTHQGVKDEEGDTSQLHSFATEDLCDDAHGEAETRLKLAEGDESKNGFFADGNASRAGERIQKKAEQDRGEGWEDSTDELDSFATEDNRDDVHGEVELHLKPVAEDDIAPVVDSMSEKRRKSKARERMEGKGGKDDPIEIDLDKDDDDLDSSDEDLQLYRIQLVQFRMPVRPPPASFKYTSPDEDDDLEIYQAQLRQFRSTAKSTSKTPVSAEDGCLSTESRGDCRQAPSSSVPDDSQTPLRQIRTPRPRYKQKWRVIVDSDDEFPPLGPKSRPSTHPIPSFPSSPALSDLADYRSDSPATLPPLSSSPVPPLDDGSDDELCAWNIE